ncbi:phosphatidylglycerophosphatase A family protein [Sessilibacter sp. MAH4]
MVKPNFKDICRSPSLFLAFGLGSGLAPKAPGTFGTLAAIPFYWLFADLPLAIYLSIIVFTSVIGVWICQAGSDYLDVHDHPSIVWDEFVGYWITMIAAPSGWAWIVAGFVIFRIFDILKPWPISWADKNTKGGLGIMTDDILAGIFSWITLQLLAQLDYSTF